MRQHLRRLMKQGLPVLDAVRQKRSFQHGLQRPRTALQIAFVLLLFGSAKPLTFHLAVPLLFVLGMVSNFAFTREFGLPFYIRIGAQFAMAGLAQEFAEFAAHQIDAILTAVRPDCAKFGSSTQYTADFVGIFGGLTGQANLGNKAITRLDWMQSIEYSPGIAIDVIAKRRVHAGFKIAG